MSEKRFNLRKVVAIAICLAGVTVFAGCDKDDDEDNEKVEDTTFKIIATNVINSTSQIATVKAEIYWESSSIDWDYDVIAQASYKDNGFTLELPATMPEKYLESLGDLPSSITVSDRTAKYSSILEEIYAYDNKGNKIGDFDMTDDGEYGEYAVMWIYVDKNVTVKGAYFNGEYISKYDMIAKKGWNVVYGYSTDDVEDTYLLTTQKPSGVNLSWYFYDYEDEDTPFKINATNVINSTSQIATVEVELEWEVSEDDWGYDVIAEASYKDNGFTLELPATLQDKYLFLIEDFLQLSSAFTISDKTAKLNELSDIEAYDSKGNNIGYIYPTNEDYDDFDMFWWYADKNVTIKGEEFDAEYFKIDMDLKKGWNIVYGYSTDDVEDTYLVTTQKPSGVDLSWYFDDYGNEYAVAFKPAKVLSDKILFRQKKNVEK